MHTRLGQHVETFPEFRWIGGALLLSLSLLTPNPLITAACALAVPLFALLLWRRGEPPVLLLIAMFQWLQVSIRVFHADFVGLRLDEMDVSLYRPVESAIWLGLAALVVLALGMRLGAGRAARNESAGPAEAEVEMLHLPRLFAAYLALAVAGLLVSRYGWRYLGFSQLLVAVASLKAVPLFLLVYASFKRHTGSRYVVAAVVLEVMLGMGGYFAGFKTVFFILFLGVIAASPRVTRRGAIATVAGFVVLLVLILFWTSIKAKYRPFLNQGTGAQVVTVGWGDRLRFIGREARRTTTSDLAASVEPLINRVAYVRFLADAINYVPAVVPHADGAIWGGAVRHIFMPRILVPQKPILPSDSELTMRYTGVKLAGGGQGTSISMGYAAEAYVDFGFRAMWFPIFLMGALWGLMYRALMRTGGYVLLRHGFAVALFLPFIAFETTVVKLLGGSMSSFLILFVILAFGSARLWRWLEAAPRSA